MFSNASIRSRLLLIVLGVTALTVLAVALIALGGSAATLQAQTQAALLNANQTLANTLDTKLQAVAATTQLLAATLTRQSASPSELWQTASNTLMQPDVLISRINVYAPFRGGGRQLVIFDDPTAPSSTAPLSQLINPTIPDDAWFLQAMNDNRLVWNGPADGFYDTSGQQMISVAVPYVGHNGRPIGVVWSDVTLRSLQRALQSSINMTDRRGYSLLINQQSSVVTFSQLPARSGVLRQAEAARVLNQFLATSAVSQMLQTIQPEKSRYVFASDPFNEERSSVVLGSVMPATWWRMVSVLPGSALDNPLALNAIQAGFVSLLGLATLGVVVYLFLNRTLTKPLADLSEAAQEIGSGDLRYQIAHLNRGDEIGRLAGALEDMKRNLEHSYHELSLWSQMLEKRVAERTEQLEAARQEAQLHAAELRTLYDASLSVVEASELLTVLEATTQRILWLLRATYCAVWLLTEDKEHLRLAATTSEDKSRLNTVVSIDQGLAGLSVREGQPVRLDDYVSWPGRLDSRTDSNMVRAMATPLMFYGRPMGAVIVGRKADDAVFDDSDERLLVLFANLVSPVVRNAQLYVQREEALQAVESASEVKTRFLASVTHELRTPLNLIINNMDFMRVGSFGPVTEEQVARLTQGIRSAEHLLYLINDLLDVSKIEAGEMQLFIQEADLYPVIEDALDTAVMLMESKHSEVALEAFIPPDLPPVPMDARRIRQVLTNLLSNAVKFTLEGSIYFMVRKLDDDWLEFTVTDTGIGIPPEEMNRMFEAFERTRRAKQLGIEGTGLGLPISRYLVEAHGGQMRVETAVGQGSSFSFTLPLRRPDKETSTSSAAVVVSAPQT